VTDQHADEGGAERIVSGLVTGLDERGHDVALFTARNSPDAPELPSRVKLRVVPWAGEGDKPDPNAPSRVVEAAEAFAPDVVHLHSIFDAGVVDVLRARWPTVWTCHDHRSHCPNGDRRYPRSGGICSLAMGAACVRKSLTQGCVAGPRLRTLTELRNRERLFASLLRVDRIGAPSRCVAKLLATNGTPGSRVVQAPLFTPFADTTLEESPDRSGERVLFVGRLVPQKGINDILWLGARLARDRPNASLQIAGDGPERGKVDSAAAAGQVRPLGKLDRDALARAYAAANVVVVTPRWLDPFPVVGLEAGAFGLPVVAYALGGIGELVEDGRSGLLVPPGDREALWRAVERLLRDPGLAAEMGRHGREVVRVAFRPKIALAAAESLYEEARVARGGVRSIPKPRIENFRAGLDERRFALALEVRIAVFVREQDVPLEAELDSHDRDDPTCLHVIVIAQGGRGVATGRIFDERPEVGRVGRMAVLPAFRGVGIGMQILEALLAEAGRRGHRQVVLDAQTHAIEFYRRRGFMAEGQPFDDCGISHQLMRLKLRDVEGTSA